MIVVSDTTVLSTLYLIDKVDWLRQLFGEIIIPEAVFDELKELEKFGHDIGKFQNSVWIAVRSIKSPDLVKELGKYLDTGESEAIALALEVNADYLLIDERKGSEKATEMGITTIGLLRVILELKQRKLIPLVKPVLDDIKHKGGFWISKKLYKRVLLAANEDFTS